MDIIKITYCFKMDDGKQEHFLLQLDSDSLELITDKPSELPAWTALEHRQCPHCPYQKEARPHCPVATQLVGVIERFEEICSFDEIDLEVITEGRHILQRTTAQRAISSLLGLLFATSGCIYTAYMKPMARFHLPLASQEETAYRAVGMYLLAEYFKKAAGKDGKLDMGGLKKIYRDLHEVNVAITERMRSAMTTEASINALVILDTRANLMPFVIEEHFEAIRHLFDVYLSDHHSENE